MDNYDSDHRLILQGFSRSTRFTNLCTFAPLESKWKKPWKTTPWTPHEKTLPQSVARAHCTAPNSKIQLNFVKHFRIFTVLFSIFQRWLANLVQNSPILMNFFRDFSNFHGEDQNLLDSQISWDSAPEQLNFSGNEFRKVRKKLEKVRRS